jgi:hypothetical protein
VVGVCFPSGYTGECFRGISGQWIISIPRTAGDQRRLLKLEPLFSRLSTLRAQLENAGLEVKYMDYASGGLIIGLAFSENPADVRLLRAQGAKVVQLLKEHYSSYNGVEVNWAFDAERIST